MLVVNHNNKIIKNFMEIKTKELTKKEKMAINKGELIDRILQDLKENLYESEDYIFALAKEALMTRTQKDLKSIIP